MQVNVRDAYITQKKFFTTLYLSWNENQVYRYASMNQ